MTAYRDSSLTADARARNLLAQMTLTEKCAQLGSAWVYEMLDHLTFDPGKAAPLLNNGIGHITRIGGASNLTPRQSAELANTIQRYLLENTRLGIPAVVHEECCSGYMAYGATVFPQTIGVASTWQPELVQAMGDVIRRQMRSVGGHHALAPVLDVARDARWGRLEETFGEDPYLIARMGSAYIMGIQSDDLRDGVIATAKHFVGYGVSEGGMNWAPPHIMGRELREVYLFPFEAAVRAAKLASLMNAYHELDGIPCGASRELLTEILRDEWGFNGTVVSDYSAIDMLKTYHNVAQDRAEAAFEALNAGMDVELPRTTCYGDVLREAVEAGRVPLELVDLSVERLLTQKFMLGLFEQPYVDPSIVVFDTPDERGLARTLAAQSLVLLKNEGVLPLATSQTRIALIGPNVDSTRNLFGDYAYPAHVESMLEARRGTHALGFDMPLPDGLSQSADFIQVVSIRAALEAQLGAGVQLTYARGCDVNSRDTSGFPAAVAAAQSAQVAIMVMGDKAGLTDDCTSGEARDRADLRLPGVQHQLVQAVVATGTPVVLVLVNGRPVALDDLEHSLAAVLVAWFPGEEGAAAVADALTGAVNPGGKLPITFPRSAGQIPVFYNHRPSGGRSHWKGDYVELSSKPLYPFGHGLSYTQFMFECLRIDQPEVRMGDSVTISIDVTNTGARAGDEVVQLYTHQFGQHITRPVKELRGFQRVTLQPGERRTVTFTLSVEQLAFYDKAMRLSVQPGTVDVMIGSSSQAIHASDEFAIVGDVAYLDKRSVYFTETRVE